MQVLKSIQSQVNDICFGKTCADLVNLALVNLLVKWNVKDLQDCDHHLLSSFNAASAFYWPLLDTQKLIVSHHGAEKLHTVLYYKN